MECTSGVKERMIKNNGLIQTLIIDLKGSDFNITY
jgi:hypothetical protein